jgi:hypothetical protein
MAAVGIPYLFFFVGYMADGDWAALGRPSFLFPFLVGRFLLTPFGAELIGSHCFLSVSGDISSSPISLPYISRMVWMSSAPMKYTSPLGLSESGMNRPSI